MLSWLKTDSLNNMEIYNTLKTVPWDAFKEIN